MLFLTSFFHTRTLVRRKRNKIQGLFLENGTDDAILQAEAINYFKQLFDVDHFTTPNETYWLMICLV